MAVTKTHSPTYCEKFMYIPWFQLEALNLSQLHNDLMRKHFYWVVLTCVIFWSHIKSHDLSYSYGLEAFEQYFLNSDLPYCFCLAALKALRLQHRITCLIFANVDWHFNFEGFFFYMFWQTGCFYWFSNVKVTLLKLELEGCERVSLNDSQ